MEYRLNKDMTREAEFYASNFEEEDKTVGATTYSFRVVTREDGYVEVWESHTGHTQGCFFTEYADCWWYGRPHTQGFFDTLQTILRDFKYIW